MAKSAFGFQYLVKSLSPTGASTSAAAQLPWSNLNDPQPRYRARMAATALSLIFDLGSAQAVDFAFLGSTSLGLTDSVLVRGSAVDATAGSNLLLQSNTFNNAAWSKNGSVIAATGVADPFGGSTATELDEDTSTGTHTLEQTVAGLPDNITVRLSIYVDAMERDFCQFRLVDKASTDHFVIFNLGTETVGS
jgi:hypothetical protein